MKKILSMLASVAVIGIILTGCSTTNTGEDYFGYSPKHKVQEPDVRTIYDNNNNNADDNQGTWQNPLSDNYDNTYSNAGGVYNSYNPLYVPVIVPWWYNYYGWMSYPFYRRHYYSGFYISFGYSPFDDYYNDWYSPWYDYNPYYGYYWPTNTYYGYYGWFRQPYYAYNPGPAVPRKNRNFGPSRDGNVLTNSGTGGDWRINRTGYSGSSSSGYSSGRRTVYNTTPGSVYSTTGSVYSSGSGRYNRSGNGNTSNGSVYSQSGSKWNSNSGTGYNKSGNNGTNRSFFKNGADNANPGNQSGGQMNRNSGAIKGNPPSWKNEGGYNSGSAVKRSFGKSIERSTPAYTRPSGGISFPSFNRSSGGSRNSGGYSAPSRSSSGSSNRSSSGSNGGSNRSRR